MKIGNNKTKVTRELTRKERNRRNNTKRIAISLLVAFILFIALTVIQSSILNQEKRVRVLQFKKDVAEGTQITKENIGSLLGYKEVSESLVPSGYITDANETANLYTNRNYKERDILTSDGLKKSGIEYSELDNPVAVSFSVNGIADSVAGTLRNGDYVNIYSVSSGLEFKHLFIEEARDSSGKIIESDDRKSDAALFTVIVDEADYKDFIKLSSKKDLTLTKLKYNTKDTYRVYRNDESVATDENGNIIKSEQ